MSAKVRCHVLAVLPLLGIVLAFGLRLIDLGGIALWGDEAWSLYLAGRSLADLTLETGYDIHPPLYYYLLHAWRLAAGLSVFSVRYLSVFPGTLVVAATFAVGRRLGSRRTGLIGSVLLACAPFAVYYSHEVRPFMWATLWCVLALYVLLRTVASPSPWLWAAYAFLSLLSAFTLYSTAVWYAAHGILLLLGREWRRRLPTWLGLEAAVLALSLPWLLLFGRATGEHLSGQGAFTGRDVLSPYVLAAQTLRGLLGGVTLPETAAWALSAVILLISSVGIAVARPRALRAAGLFSLLTALPVLALYPIHMAFPWFEPRVLAFCIVPLCLLIAVGLDGWCTRRQWACALASGILLFACGWGLYDYLARYTRYSPDLEDYGPLVAHVANRAKAGDVVLYNAPWHVGYFEATYSGPALDFEPLSASAVARALGGERQVWLILRDIVRQHGGPRPEDLAEDVLSARAFKVGEAWYGHIRLAHYAVAPDDQPRYQALDTPLGSEPSVSPEILLRGFAVQPELDRRTLVVVPGQAIYLVLTWQAERSLDRVYHVFTQLLGAHNPATGSPVWAQHDGVPANQEHPTLFWAPGEEIVDRHVMWVDPDTPPGAYSLAVGMYDPDGGDRLAALWDDGTQSDYVVLAHVRVVAP